MSTIKNTAIELQVKLQEEIQGHGINLVECGDCNAVLFHRTPTLEEWKTNTFDSTIICPHCGNTQNVYDCADVYYDGIQNNKQFQS